MPMYKYTDYSSVRDDGTWCSRGSAAESRPSASAFLTAIVKGSAVGNTNPALAPKQVPFQSQFQSKEQSTDAQVFDNYDARTQALPVKLSCMLSDPQFSDIITWMPHGRAWKVLRPRDFEAKVAPHYFEYPNYNSFIRLVNAWGFRRIKEGVDTNAYFHELFLRDMPHLHRKMRRMSKKDKKMPLHPSQEPDFYKMPPLKLKRSVNGNHSCNNGPGQGRCHGSRDDATSTNSIALLGMLGSGPCSSSANHSTNAAALQVQLQKLLSSAKTKTSTRTSVPLSCSQNTSIISMNISGGQPNPINKEALVAALTLNGTSPTLSVLAPLSLLSPCISTAATRTASSGNIYSTPQSSLILPAAQRQQHVPSSSLLSLHSQNTSTNASVSTNTSYVHLLQLQSQAQALQELKQQQEERNQTLLRKILLQKQQQQALNASLNHHHHQATNSSTSRAQQQTQQPQGVILQHQVKDLSSVLRCMTMDANAHVLAAPSQAPEPTPILTTSSSGCIRTGSAAILPHLIP